MNHIPDTITDTAAVDPGCATALYLDVDGFPVVTVELFDLDIWAHTVEILARRAGAACSTITNGDSDSGPDLDLVLSVAGIMAAQMRALVQGGAR